MLTLPNNRDARGRPSRGFIASTKGATKTESRHDKKGISEKLKIGDKVLVERTWLKTNFSSKLENKWTGPYFVHEIIGDNIYKLRTMEGQKVKNIVHENRLKLYRERRMEPYLVIEA